MSINKEKTANWLVNLWPFACVGTLVIYNAIAGSRSSVDSHALKEDEAKQGGTEEISLDPLIAVSWRNMFGYDLICAEKEEWWGDGLEVLTYLNEHAAGEGVIVEDGDGKLEFRDSKTGWRYWVDRRGTTYCMVHQQPGEKE